MDAYLESLVLKGEEVAEPVEEPVVEDLVVDEAPADEPIEEVVAEPVADTNIGENGDPAVVIKEEVKEEPEQVVAPESQPVSTDYEVDKMYFVNDIRVYSVPDDTTAFMLFSGNVIYKGTVDKYLVIEYVKHGFGMVKGYTLSLG